MVRHHSLVVISLDRNSFKLATSNMKAFVVLSMALAIACSAAVDDSSRIEKRGLWDEGYGGYNSNGYGGHQEVQHQTITKNVQVPYPVKVEKEVPYEVKVPYPVHVEKQVPFVVEKQVPFVVEKNVPYNVDRPVPYPVEVKVPFIQKEYIKVPKPYPVHVEKEIPVYIHKPVYINKYVPVTFKVTEKKQKSGGWF
ncbi:uncharacterized protein LOC135715339 [Ochlerotatus camptorhynchus]|uniref:uncharacterized protein LOC135715339 n=1 Tax=Ochlerotatus camptorhynchus TaxID=644619 RepID=UPI0031D7D82C